MLRYTDSSDTPTYIRPGNMFWLWILATHICRTEKLLSSVISKYNQLSQKTISLEPNHPAKKHREFPNDPYFTRLLSAAATSDSILISDSTRGVQATYSRLLRDVSYFRQTLCDRVLNGAMNCDGVVQDRNTFVCILAPTSYHAAVATLATTAMGAAGVLLPTGLIAEEAVWMYQQCHSVGLLVAPELASLGAEMKEYAMRTSGVNIPMVEIEIAPENPTHAEPTEQLYSIRRDLVFPSTRAALVLFTSGSTGPPKVVSHSRQLLYGFSELTATGPQDTVLCHRPMFWIAGVRPLLASVTQGTRIKILADSKTLPNRIWEQLRRGHITVLTCPSMIWQSMMQIFQEEFSTALPAETLLEYIQGVQNLRIAQCTGGMPGVPAKRFWQDLRGNRPLQIIYNTTELGLPPLQTSPAISSPLEKCVIGQPNPSMSIKLSEGNHGELLIKSPYSLLEYIGNPDATAALFDDDGYIKTGDLASFDGTNYVIEGRAKNDFVRFYGYKVSRYEVEAKLSELPYILEAYILPVPDPETRHRVAALVRMRTSTSTHNPSLSLQSLRHDLSSASLSLYKQPTLLRILEDGESIQTTTTGKLDGAAAVRRYFPPHASGSIMDLPESVQVWDVRGLTTEKPTKAWDLAGICS